MFSLSSPLCIMIHSQCKLRLAMCHDRVRANNLTDIASEEALSNLKTYDGLSRC